MVRSYVHSALVNRVSMMQGTDGCVPFVQVSEGQVSSMDRAAPPQFANSTASYSIAQSRLCIVQKK